MTIESSRRLSLLKRSILNHFLCVVIRAPIVSGLSRVVWWVHFSKWLRQTASRVTHATREQLYQAVVDRIGKHETVDYLEFGVHRGASLKWWVGALKSPATRFYGFDVFTGLPEAWGALPQGAFDCKGIPPEFDDPRVRFQIGLFQATLPMFLDHYRSAPNAKRIIHLDADLYSSTLFVLTALARELHPHDILILDEFGSVRNPMHEFRAFHDFCSAYFLDYVVVGATELYEQVALEIVSPPPLMSQDDSVLCS